MVVITASAPKVPVKTMAAEFLAAKSAAMKKVLSPSSEKNINKNACNRRKHVLTISAAYDEQVEIQLSQSEMKLIQSCFLGHNCRQIRLMKINECDKQFSVIE
uniref:GDT1-like protein 1ic isoform X2 n=1 Tax=Rhizophora mucronata TaxID=61149 RepID=A0A2P2LM03_RHIMU